MYVQNISLKSDELMMIKEEVIKGARIQETSPASISKEIREHRRVLGFPLITVLFFVLSATMCISRILIDNLIQRRHAGYYRTMGAQQGCRISGAIYAHYNRRMFDRCTNATLEKNGRFHGPQRKSAAEFDESEIMGLGSIPHAPTQRDYTITAGGG